MRRNRSLSGGIGRDEDKDEDKDGEAGREKEKERHCRSRRAQGESDELLNTGESRNTDLAGDSGH